MAFDEGSGGGGEADVGFVLENAGEIEGDGE